MLFATAIILLPVSGHSQGDASAYQVTGVRVDVTADTAAAASQIAIRRGQREAFNTLLRRMILAEDRDRLPELDDNAIESYVETIGFENERYSSTRYVADVRVGFRPDDIRALLRRLNIPFAEAMGRSVVVLPVYQDRGVTLLWDNPNGWRSAWEQSNWNSSLLPFVLPTASQGNAATITSQQALFGNEATLGAFAEHYETTEVLVPYARWTIDLSTGEPILEIDIRLHGVGGLQRWSLKVAQRTGEDESVFLKRAASQVATTLGRAWKQRAMVSVGEQSTIEVVADLGGLADLQTMKQRLGRAPMIQRTSVESLSTSRAVLALTMTGEADQVSESLTQYGINLVRNGTRWHLSLRQ
ncbi:MAG: DUF2066 domain-containing protein [Proteobacteria bacterium]|nr:DUF2066 domain-containing protein [Pseudomonadota bacterium]